MQLSFSNLFFICFPATARRIYKASAARTKLSLMIDAQLPSCILFYSGICVSDAFLTTAPAFRFFTVILWLSVLGSCFHSVCRDWFFSSCGFSFASCSCYSCISAAAAAAFFSRIWRWNSFCLAFRSAFFCSLLRYPSATGRVPAFSSIRYHGPNRSRKTVS